MLPDARGRKSLRTTAPAAVKLAKRLSRRGLSLRRIAAKLAEAGQLNENGQPYNAQSIRAMLRGRRSASGQPVAEASKRENARGNVVLVAYLDDSGTDKRASVVTMAGYVACLKDWRRFESRARQFLRRENVERLHAKEFQDRAGFFKGWGAAKQLAFVTGLYHCAAEAGVLMGFSRSTLKRVYRQRGQETGLNRNRSPYGWCFQMLVERMLTIPTLAERIRKDGLAFVIESGNANNGDVEAIFHRFVRTKEFGLEKVLRSITFVSKDSCVAIQLADFIAYYTRRHTEACIEAGGPLSELPPYIEIAKAHMPHDGFVATDFHGPLAK